MINFPENYLGYKFLRNKTGEGKKWQQKTLKSCNSTINSLGLFSLISLNMDTEEDINQKISSQKVKELTDHQNKRAYKWQRKLLPWIIIMPTILILLFIYLATVQVKVFNDNVYEEKDEIIASIINNYGDSSYVINNREYLQWLTLSALEEETINNRYKQGGLLLISRIFTKYLGFFTGMILAIVGAVFIISKYSENETKLDGSIHENAKFNLVTSSPGIIFGLLGTILMAISVLEHNTIEVTDEAQYLTPSNTYILYLQSRNSSQQIIESITPDDLNIFDNQMKSLNSIDSIK